MGIGQEPGEVSSAAVTLDAEALLCTMASRPGLLERTVQVFLSAWHEQLGALECALSRADYRGAEHEAHRLKGELAILRALRGADLARAVERAAKRGDDPVAKQAFDHLRDEMGAVERELLALLAALRAAERPYPASRTGV